MVREARNFWESLTKMERVLSTIILVFSVVTFVVLEHVQNYANASAITVLADKQESYNSLALRIDRRLYRLEIVHKIVPEVLDGGSHK